MITENKIEDWHTLNAPFGFTDCEKSAWSVGYREGAEAVRNALATQAPTKFRVGDRIVEHPDNGHGYATVTELTERGFKYVLDTPSL